MLAIGFGIVVLEVGTVVVLSDPPPDPHAPAKTPAHSTADATSAVRTGTVKS
jgi:hypothetical protein